MMPRRPHRQLLVDELLNTAQNLASVAFADRAANSSAKGNSLHIPAEFAAQRTHVLPVDHG